MLSSSKYHANAPDAKVALLEIAFKDNFAWLFVFAKKIVQNDQAAEDIVIEAFTKLWESSDIS